MSPALSGTKGSAERRRGRGIWAVHPAPRPAAGLGADGAVQQFRGIIRMPAVFQFMLIEGKRAMKAKILVEDNEPLTSFLRPMLKRAGFQWSSKIGDHFPRRHLPGRGATSVRTHLLVVLLLLLAIAITIWGATRAFGFNGEEHIAQASAPTPICWAENSSYLTTCAEEDNVNVPIFGPQVTHFRVVATHPVYCPCAYDGCPPDFSGCPPDGDGGTVTCSDLWYEDGVNVVVVCTDTAWWRPYSMAVIANGKTADAHYLVLHRKIQGVDSWPQFLVLYQNGNVRLKPHPPEGIEDVCFGSSVIIGPAAPATRPYADIQEVRVNPSALSLDITYGNAETAHINLFVDRSQAVAEVEMGYSTSTEIPFITFRSMWVDDGNCDVAYIQSPDGDFPILGSWTSLNGPWWFFHRKSWSKHNTSAPDIRISAPACSCGRCIYLPMILKGYASQ